MVPNPTNGIAGGITYRLDLGFKSEFSWWVETTVDRLFSHRLQFTMPQWKWGLRLLGGIYYLTTNTVLACVNVNLFVSAFTVDLRQQLQLVECHSTLIKSFDSFNMTNRWPGEAFFDMCQLSRH